MNFLIELSSDRYSHTELLYVDELESRLDMAQVAVDNIKDMLLEYGHYEIIGWIGMDVKLKVASTCDVRQYENLLKYSNGPVGVCKKKDYGRY